MALEAGITEEEYWWVYTPAQLLRKMSIYLKQKQDRMWEMAWFTRMILATQGSKIDNIYDLLPFEDPNAEVISTYVGEPEVDDVSYVKEMMARSAKTVSTRGARGK